MKTRSLGEALHRYLLAEIGLEEVRTIAENPALLSEEALMRIATLRANAWAVGERDLAETLHDKYGLLERWIGLDLQSRPAECRQALMAILQALADDPEPPSMYLALAGVITAPETSIDRGRLPHELQDDVLRAMCLGVLARLGDPTAWDRSIRLLEHTLDRPSIRRYPELRGSLRILLGFGYLSTPLGDREENLLSAIACFEEALAFYSDMPNSWEYGNVQGNLGVAYAQRVTGDRFENLRRAITCQQEALRAYTRIECPQYHAAVLYNLAVAHSLLVAVHGDAALRTAIGYLREVLEVFGRDAFPVDYAMTQNSLGNAYRRLSGGNQEENLLQARACYREALEIYTARNMQMECTTVAANLGRAYESLAATIDALGNLEKAIEHFDRALRLCPSDERSLLVREIQASRGTAYGKLARLTRSREDTQQAIRALEESIRPSESGRADLDTLRAAWDLGDIGWGSGGWEPAPSGDPPPEGKQWRIAARGYLRAVEILDTLLAGATKMDQVLLIDRTRDLYPRAIKAAYRLGQFEDCLTTAERAKSRRLLYDLAQTDFHPPATVPHSMAQEESALMEKRDAVRELLREAEQGDVFLVRAPGGFSYEGEETPVGHVTRSRLWQELERTESELQRLYRRMESNAPDYVDIRRATTPTIKDIRRFVDGQGRGATLLYFYTMPDSILVFGLAAEREELVAVQIRKPLPILVEELRPLLVYSEPDNPLVRRPEFPDDPLPRMLLDLSSELLPEKVTRLLESTSRLYVIPQGPLHWLPFQTLLWRGEPLICHFPVVQSPSIGTAIRAQKRRREGHLPVAAFGFAREVDERPVLEGEARRIAAMLGGKAIVGKQCKRQLVCRLAKGARVLHISSHGEFDPLNPLASGVVLADGRLTARGIMEELQLPGSLVTLSACETGHSTVEVGDELIGLMRAFFLAGASSLILSMWPVDKTTTVDLMTMFYDSVHKGQSRADALRNAALGIREEKPHPYYWAPFVLLGDWR